MIVPYTKQITDFCRNNNMKYRHFSGFDMDSNFENLAGHVQRAIEAQANIDLMAHKFSECSREEIDGEDKEIELFNKLCDEYANKSEQKLKELVILDSKALYYYSLTSERMSFYESQARERALQMDKNAAVNAKANARMKNRHNWFSRG